MKNLLTFVSAAVILGLALFLSVILGDYGPWYFAWLIGTTMIILISAAGAAMFDSQDEELSQQGVSKR
ncbi:hypothetical protein [Candidatus Igneacidithiobacillus taiwanensis]|uniref:hypothetical protein n=1 Tax=Candidatus Igneacidithiobacillus taiwanensis TaxID=1945924 RepID=UPI002898EA28|nr:hypothetical protein [Candidatus Igneacidithiobacillus taiwanensis]MCE5393378.1 hypothetical protein [Acidithiobacillus sp.]